MSLGVNDTKNDTLSPCYFAANHGLAKMLMVADCLQLHYHSRLYVSLLIIPYGPV